MSRIQYLTANDLYTINEDVTQSLPFVRDRHLLLSAVNRPKISLFGEPQFPSLHDKAAALLESVAYHHLFADGNKRTALRAVTLFFELNGWQTTWEAQQEYDYILEIAQGKHTHAEISAWLAHYTRAITK
jgi:death-on-curing protein